MKKILLFTAALFLTLFTYAQKPKVVSGDFSNISSIKKWKTTLEFGEPEIHKWGTYEEFIKKMMAKKDEKEEGLGEVWLSDWNSAIENDYLPKFCLLANKYLKDNKVRFIQEGDKDENDFEGTIVIRPYWVYLGSYNPVSGVSPSKVSSKIHFYDKNDKEILVINMIESPGGGFSTANSYGSDGAMTRMIESFAKCGKDMAGFFAKKVYK